MPHNHFKVRLSPARLSKTFFSQELIGEETSSSNSALIKASYQPLRVLRCFSENASLTSQRLLSSDCCTHCQYAPDFKTVEVLNFLIHPKTGPSHQQDLRPEKLLLPNRRRQTSTAAPKTTRRKTTRRQRSNSVCVTRLQNPNKPK